MNYEIKGMNLQQRKGFKFNGEPSPYVNKIKELPEIRKASYDVIHGKKL